jgi:CRP/FNR family transcriptional regulator
MLATFEASQARYRAGTLGTSQPVSGDTGSRIPAPGTPHRIAAEKILFAEGDAAPHVFEVTKGVLRLCRLLPDGRRSITGFAYPGDVIGLSVRNLYAYSAEAVTDCELKRFSRAALSELIERSSEFARGMFAIVADELCSAQDQMLLLGRKTAAERVASFLLGLAERQSPTRGERDHVELPMSRTDIADYLGLTTETVCRVLTKLRQSGVINLPSPQRVEFVQPQTLREMADEGQSGGREPMRKSGSRLRRTETVSLLGNLASAPA